MRAGDLRHRVRLQRESVTDDQLGTSDVSFVDVETVWASVTTTGGREFWEAKKLNPELTHQLEMRFRTDVSGGMRIRWGDVVLRIVAPMDPEGRRVRLLCFCTELVQ